MRLAEFVELNGDRLMVWPDIWEPRFIDDGLVLLNVGMCVTRAINCSLEEAVAELNAARNWTPAEPIQITSQWTGDSPDVETTTVCANTFTPPVDVDLVDCEINEKVVAGKDGSIVLIRESESEKEDVTPESLGLDKYKKAFNDACHELRLFGCPESYQLNTSKYDCENCRKTQDNRVVCWASYFLNEKNEK